MVDSINESNKKIKLTHSELSSLNNEHEKKVNEKTQLILEQRTALEFSSKMTSLGEMAGGIAHEINNPLTIISASSNMLKKFIEKGDIDYVKFNKSLQDIDNTIIRISKIINGLRNVSRDSSQEVFNKAMLKEIFEDVLALCSEKFKNNSIDIEINLDDELYNTYISCCRIQLSQVFLNLMGNAYDAIESLNIKWVSITIKRLNDTTIALAIMDSGSGISNEIQDKIFNPFFTTKEIGKGTGLGLSLSYTIIKNHNGRFYIDNSSPHTCFVIELPINVG